MSIKGAAYANFRSALRSGNLLLAKAAAAELPQVGLTDALHMCLLMSSQADERFDRAATRWLARFAQERPSVGLDELRHALFALEALPYNPDAARGLLARLCTEHGLPEAARMLRSH